MSSEIRNGLPRLSHARDLSRPGFYVKLVLMMLVNAFGLYGVMASYGQQKWGVPRLPRRDDPARRRLHLLLEAGHPRTWSGLIFLFVFQIYVMLNTAYVAFTNYGDGHNAPRARRSPRS